MNNNHKTSTQSLCGPVFSLPIPIAKRKIYIYILATHKYHYSFRLFQQITPQYTPSLITHQKAFKEKKTKNCFHTHNCCYTHSLSQVQSLQHLYKVSLRSFLHCQMQGSILSAKKDQENIHYQRNCSTHNTCAFDRYLNSLYLA